MKFVRELAELGLAKRGDTLLHLALAFEESLERRE
jgi:hypothetical protein